MSGNLKRNTFYGQNLHPVDFRRERLIVEDEIGLAGAVGGATTKPYDQDEYG